MLSLQTRTPNPMNSPPRTGRCPVPVHRGHPWAFTRRSLQPWVKLAGHVSTGSQAGRQLFPTQLDPGGLRPRGGAWRWAAASASWTATVLDGICLPSSLAHTICLHPHPSPAASSLATDINQCPAPAGFPPSPVTGQQLDTRRGLTPS
ncbi:hypothetical protein KIL84_006992 [Mauremys mutica]|uniref:Uncharacterized protein n=1 Tax=Mauremys mutica TaxID=74926 RepID=A0A9D4AV51_9SAUR|nr:hypothetical protein KIL84_006992 [Mauremys mutica]